MANTRECELIREDLVGLIEGDLAPALSEHLADCDACRDLRHDARRAVAEVAASGDDYAPPPDLESRLLDALDARAVERGEDTARPVMTATAPSAALPVPAPLSAPVTASAPAPAVETATAAPGPAPAFDPAIAATLAMPATPPPGSVAYAPAPAPAPAPVFHQAHTLHQAPAPQPARTATAAISSRRRAAWVGGGLLLAAAASAPFLLRRGDDASTPAGNTAAQEATNPWHGRLVEVARASADRGAGGVEVRLAGAQSFAPLAQGAEVPPGAELRTDARTRARLDLADGSHIVLDRATTLVLDRGVARAAQLRAGNVVADVSHVDGAPPARVALPDGGVTVLGTKFALTAADGRSTVRVTRGVVRLANGRGQEVEVKTGEEGVLASAGANPEVAPAVDLAGSIAWSELTGELRTERDAPIVGLGELRARRPGQTAERDHAVTLSNHQVRVRIVGNIARTEIEETFRNDTANQLEGIYRFPLPPEAQIERLALDINGRMEDGEFVDRTRAAAIWRGVIRNAVHPMQAAQDTQELVWVPGPWHDPALLEWQRGGRFELRVFPIPARGSRRVAISYTQNLASSGGVRRYVYPLAHDANGSTRVDQFDVDVQVMGNDAALGVRAQGYPLVQNAAGAPAGASRLTYSQAGFVPAGDLVVEYALPNRAEQLTAWAYQPTATAAPTTAAPSSAASLGRRGTLPAPAVAAVPAAPEEAYVAFALRPTLPRWTDARPRDYAVIVDASRSMVGERMARATRLARAMVNEMDPRDRVVVLACDTSCRTMPGGLQSAGAQAAQTAEAFLAGQAPAGASDLVAQVREASAAVRGAPDRDARIVYLGDGAATVGYRRPEMVGAEVADAMPQGRATLTAVALGGDADTTLLGAMARAGGGALVPYVPGESVATASLSVLEATYGVTLRDPVLTLPAGLAAIAPTQLSTIRAGGEAVVVARMSGTEVRGEAVLRGTVGGEAFEARYPIVVRATTAAGNAFVPRLYAATRISELEARGGEGSRDEIVRLSQRFHVASRHTSLLVLESDAMYRAFNVQRGGQTGVANWTGDSQTESTQAVALNPIEQQQVAQAAGAAPSDRDRAVDDTNQPALGGLDNRADTASERREVAGAGEDESDAHPTFGELASSPATGASGGGSMARGRSSGYGSGALSAPARRSASREAVAAEPMTATAAPPPPPSVTMPAAAPRPSFDQAWGADGQGRAGNLVTATPSGGAVAVTRRPALGGRRWGTWMRRVWVRRGSVVSGAAGVDRTRIEEARTALQALPDSRDRTRELFRRLSIAGEFEDAATVATQWSTRDALDPEAITRLADVAARRGQRDLAVRILAGIVDVRPDDVANLERMAQLHDRAGDNAQACAYRVAIAEVRPTDEAALTAAIRCERAQGRAASAGRVLNALSDARLRARVETAATAPAPAPGAVRGDVTVQASWDVPTDLDVALVDARGNRISWMGGRAGITARGPRDQRAEGLGVSRPPAGEYTVEISRAAHDGRMVRGQVDITALGERRSIPVTLMPGVNTQRIARVVITREAQMVPVNGWE